MVETEYENGKLVSILRCKYNEMGFLTSKNRIRWQTTGYWDTILSTYTYDTIAGIKRILSTVNRYGQTPEKYYYNEKGLLVYDTSYERSQRYHYDTLNRIEEQITSVSGKDCVLFTWTYLRDGSIKKCEFYLTENTKRSETIYTDSTEIYRFYHKGKTIQTLFKQKDISGNNIFSTSDIEHGCLTTSGYYRYYYNVSNDMVMEEHNSVGQDPKIIQHEYIYDKAGNWLHFDKTKKRAISYW